MIDLTSFDAEKAGQYPIKFEINGETKEIEVGSRDTLLDTIRDKLGLTGAKKGCEEGVCGSCTVLVNGNPLCSCMMFSVEANDSEIVTIEGLEAGNQLALIQEEFVDNDAMQCGFCTSGQVLAAQAFLDHVLEDHKLQGMLDDEIKDAMSGNLCRCGCYNSIVDAIKSAANKRLSGRV